MKKFLEVDIIILAVSHAEGEKCANFLKSCSHSEETLRIMPKYWITGKGDNQFNIREDMLLILYADSKIDFDRCRAEIKDFPLVKSQFLLSNKEEAKTWASEHSDLGLKVYVGLQEETLCGLRDIIRISVPAVHHEVKNY